MKMKKIISCAAAAVMALSMAAVSASAADWSQAGYADEDPNTVNIISTSAEGATFTATSDGAQAKLRITLSDVLADPADVSKIKSGSWTVTYSGLSSLSGTAVGWLGGGTYCATCNSAGYGLAPAEYAEDGTAVWDDTQSVEDSFKWLLPSQVPAAAEEAEFVFIDWSGADGNIYGNGITVTISDFKLYDEDGNEIAQKDYSGDAAAAVEEEAPAAEEEAAAEEAAPVEEVAPASDDVSASASTGNASAAAIASVMAVAGVAAIAAKKRK